MRQPLLTPISDRLFIVVEPYVYEWEKEGVWYSLEIPQGFKTDIASVPRWVWSAFGILPDGLHRGAAVLHDFLYRTNKPEGWPRKNYFFKVNRFGEKEDISHVKWSRKACDKLFMRCMKEAKVRPWKRKVMFRAVRLFAWWGWRN